MVAPAAAVAAGAAAIVLHLGAPAGGPHLRFADLVAGVAFSLAGVLVVRREPRNAAGWLLVATAVLALGPAANEAAWRLLAHDSHSRPGEALLWVTNWIWVPYLLLPTLLVLLLPHGRLPSRRWRPVARAIVALTVLVALCAMTRPGGSDQITSIDNPLGIGGAGFLTVVMAIGVGLVLGVGGALCIGGVLARLRAATGVDRARLQWLAAGAAAAGTAFVGSVAAPWPIGEILLALGIAALPCGIAIAVWHHKLYDVELVLNRALASLGIVAAGLIVYAAVVAASDRLAPLAAAALALVAASVWSRAQRLAARLLYGKRDEPFAVVESVGSRIDAVGAPAQALQALVETMRDALRLPYVAVVGTASAGAVVAGVDEFPCIANGRRVSQLAVGHRHAGERWRDDERALFADCARRAGALVEAGRLVADLERSRNALVAVREEERRRLRHDLHDGIASALAGISLQLDVLDEQEPSRVGEAIVQIRESTRAVADEVRALVNDLRPPALDQLGLVAAVREQAAAWNARLHVVVNARANLPALPAATEVAAYRVAGEAIANAARHSGADQCRVLFDVASPWLVVDVSDDGQGFDTAAAPGVGLDAMRTRAVEVGGSLQITSDQAGTHIVARLPLEIR